MGLSIPEIPSDAVDSEHPGHLEAGHDVVLISENIALLVADYRAHDPNLEQRGNRLGRFRPNIGVGGRKRYVRAVLVDARDAELEVAPRESAREGAPVADLGATLIFGCVGVFRRPMLEPGVDSEAAANRTANRSRPRRQDSWRCGKKKGVVGDGRETSGSVCPNVAAREPWTEEPQRGFTSHGSRARHPTTGAGSRDRAGNREERQRLGAQPDVGVGERAKSVVLHLAAYHSNWADQVSARAGGVVVTRRDRPETVLELHSERAQRVPTCYVVLCFGGGALESVADRQRGRAAIGAGGPLEPERAEGEGDPRPAVGASRRATHVGVGVGGVERKHGRPRQAALDVARWMISQHESVDA